MASSTSSFPVALLAGGLASRLGPMAATTPKLLVEVAGEPFFSHQLRLLKKAGLHRVIVCLGHLGEQVVARYGDGGDQGMQIDYVFDGPKLLGTGGALIAALPKLGQTFYVLYGDSYLTADYQAVGQAFVAGDKPALMTVYGNANRFDVSNVWFENGIIKAYDKRNRRPEMQHIDYGLSVFRSDVFAEFAAGSVVDLAEVQSALARRGALAGFEVPERFYEIGSPAGLRELDARLRARPV